MMALGTKFGTKEPSSEKRTDAYELAQRFFRRFEKENGSVLCRELVGYDLSDPDSWKRRVKRMRLKKSAPFSYRKRLRLC